MKGSTKEQRRMLVDPNDCDVALPWVGFGSKNHLVVFFAQGDTKAAGASPRPTGWVEIFYDAFFKSICAALSIFSMKIP